MILGRVLRLVQDLGLMVSESSAREIVNRARSYEVFRWQLPLEGWVKINSNGDVSSSLGHAACGGLLRNHKEMFIVGFSARLGVCYVLHPKV